MQRQTFAIVLRSFERKIIPKNIAPISFDSRQSSTKSTFPCSVGYPQKKKTVTNLLRIEIIENFNPQNSTTNRTREL